MKTPPVPKVFAERLRTPEYAPGGVCEDINWTQRPGCLRRTNWRCGECGRWVCATHAHWHRRPPGATIGRLVCERTTVQIPGNHPALRGHAGR